MWSPTNYCTTKVTFIACVVPWALPLTLIVYVPAGVPLFVGGLLEPPPQPAKSSIKTAPPARTSRRRVVREGIARTRLSSAKPYSNPVHGPRRDGQILRS